MPKVLFILLMSLIIASGPFAVGSFLPGLPSIAEYLGVGDNAVASLVSFYIFGLALGQLIGGPLLDRGDKKRIIIFGLLIYAASSALIGFAHNLHVIQTSRIFQAMGGGFAGVCVPALVRERATGNEAARLFSFIGLIMALAPAISPSVGAMILTMTGRWQNIFHFMALYALLVAFLTAVSLPKSPPQSLPPKTAIHRRYFAAMKNIRAMRYLIVLAASFAILMVFTTNASLIYQEHYGLSVKAFAMVFVLNTAVNLAITLIGTKLLKRISAHQMLRTLVAIQAFFVTTLVIFTVLELSVYLYTLAIIGSVSVLGAIIANSSALYMSLFDENTGSAAAVLGVGQFLTSALAGALSTLLYNGTLWPLALIMLFLAITANLSLPQKKVEKAAKLAKN